MRNLKSLILVLMAVALFSSCTKDGPTGATGLTGVTGPTGATGNGNVYVITPSVAFWSDSVTYWCTNIQDPYLTATVQDSGTVQVFLSTNSGANYIALPTTFLNTPNNYMMNYTTQTGSVEITWQETNGTASIDPDSFFGTTCSFKVVAIPNAKKVHYPINNLNK